jgi:hypothetical protein
MGRGGEEGGGEVGAEADGGGSRYPGQNLNLGLVDNTCLRASASVFFLLGVYEGEGVEGLTRAVRSSQAQRRRSTDQQIFRVVTLR